MTELILSITNPDSNLEIDGKSLCLRQPTEALQRYPLGLLTQLIVVGNCRMDTRVYRVLSTRNIAVVLLPGRGKGEAAMNTAALISGGQHRRHQHQANDEQRLVIARQVVRHKINGYRTLAKLHYAQQSDNAELEISLAQAKTTDTLMGIEGAEARRWFQLLSERLAPQWQFSGRNRRPPQDPVNALLSFGYSLLQSVAMQAVQGCGLDPANGMLHQNYPGRAGLVLDVCEPFRAGIDHQMLQLTELLSPENFSTSELEGCRLNKSAMRTFFKSWGDLYHNWPPVLAEASATYVESAPALLPNMLRYCKQLCQQLADGTDVWQ